MWSQRNKGLSSADQAVACTRCPPCHPPGKRQLSAERAFEACAAQAAADRAAWLQDCISLLLAVLALDRFADYVSDQVVPVVRETAAQALGMAVQPLDGPSLERLLGLLLSLRHHRNWHVRHGAMVRARMACSSCVAAFVCNHRLAAVALLSTIVFGHNRRCGP